MDRVDVVRNMCACWRQCSCAGEPQEICSTMIICISVAVFAFRVSSFASRLSPLACRHDAASTPSRECRWSYAYRCSPADRVSQDHAHRDRLELRALRCCQIVCRRRLSLVGLGQARPSLIAHQGPIGVGRLWREWHDGQDCLLRFRARWVFEYRRVGCRGALVEHRPRWRGRLLQ